MLDNPAPEEQKEFIKKAAKTAARWRTEGRKVVSLDAASIRDSPSARRGLRKRGGNDTVTTNCSRMSTHIIGDLSNGALDIKFYNDLSTSIFIDLIEYACISGQKIAIICDNASALTGNEMDKFVEKSGGSVELLHIPRNSTQLRYSGGRS